MPIPRDKLRAQRYSRAAVHVNRFKRLRDTRPQSIFVIGNGLRSRSEREIDNQVQDALESGHLN
jgi:hypothetical protein